MRRYDLYQGSQYVGFIDIDSFPTLVLPDSIQAIVSAANTDATFTIEYAGVTYHSVSVRYAASEPQRPRPLRVQHGRSASAVPGRLPLSQQRRRI